MQRNQASPGTPEWHRRDNERNDRATAARLRRDGARSLGRNLEEGAALVKLGFDVDLAFKRARETR
jgi:hypothetical protein